jgi:hypothetical protein
MNRFELEDAMSDLDQVGQDIETIIYAIGDSPIKHTEDQLLNMLIGMKQMHETRYQKMWNIFENLVKQQIISNKSVDNINLPDYDDGTMAMKIINKEGDAK